MAEPGLAPRQHEVPADAGVALSALYDRALQFARVLHAGQQRKSSGAPYLSHLLEVSGLVLTWGGSEAQAIAALLHDALEDQADAFGGADLLRHAIGSRFGQEVLHLVEVCSDCDAKPKPSWLLRKQQHLAKLAQAPADDCLVPACDKLHNLRCINSELRAGRDPFAVLKAGDAGQLWHFSAMAALFEDKGLAIAVELRHELEEMRRLMALRRPQPAQQEAGQRACATAYCHELEVR